jgi:hypothetical protein
MRLGRGRSCPRIVVAAAEGRSWVAVEWFGPSVVHSYLIGRF